MKALLLLSFFILTSCQMAQKQSSTNTPTIKICNGKEYRYTLSIKDPKTTQLFLDKRFHKENSITFLNSECISR